MHRSRTPATRSRAGTALAPRSAAFPPTPLPPPCLPPAGTCEELVSWDEVGGVQPFGRKPFLSTQGHSFRLRSAATRRFLMAHTLNDLVIRACEEDEAALRGSSVDGLESLRAQTRFFEEEAATLRERLATEVARLSLALSFGSNATATLDVGVGSRGATWSAPAGSSFVSPLVGLAK